MPNQHTFLSRWLSFTVFLLFTFSLFGCSVLPLATETPVIPATPVPTATPTQIQPGALYLADEIPVPWHEVLAQQTELKLAGSSADARMFLSIIPAAEGQAEYASFSRVYAVVAAFPTIADAVTLDELKGLWAGNAGDTFTQLLMSEETGRLLQAEWGSAASANTVTVLTAADLLDAAWKSASALAIIPFEELVPRWKVLKINGVSPLDKPLQVENYPLAFTFHLVGQKGFESVDGGTAALIAAALPATNRDESKMTVVVMSGTTALVRTTAYKIETHGVEYPIADIKDWFLSADVRHVSNEISFSQDCPDPDPWTTSLRFCSKLAYLPVLQGLGINVVELTGNHLNDYGADKLAETIAIYKENGIQYFGGGLNLEDAQQPLEIVNNGNKLAFIGCNYVGPKSDFATEESAGSAPCDLAAYNARIAELKSQGYVVFATFQHNEVYVYMYDEAYQTAFIDAAQAGADVVQGSQAHFPMGFEFSGNSLIHYGLGNLLFDQMDYPVVGTRREFVDRHIVYDGKYINTELLTAYLTDWSRPVPMTSAERAQFLTDIFKASKLK